MGQEDGHKARYRFWEARYWEETNPSQKMKIAMLLAAFAFVAARAGILVD